LFLSTLSHYLTLYPAEADTVTRVRDLVQTYPDAFYRTCQVGHITGSAWIVSAEKERCLLTHHRKLDRWLQLGGHVDGEQEVHWAALREAQEESGMSNFSFVDLTRTGDEISPNLAPSSSILPFDIDIHPIPATPTEPAHEHYDLRYLLIAAPHQPLKINHESQALRWFSWAEVWELADEEGLRRMIRKAQLHLKRPKTAESK
jgi:8-oxo-dGTP pyrophosphatase MutT (NUDIX family)